MDLPIKETLRRAIRFLEEQGYRYAIIGGIANQYWGTVRLTYDVDIKVLVPDTEYPKARAAIRAAFPERARPLAPVNPLIVDTKVEGVIVDFMLAVPGYEENIVTHAVRRDLDELSLWVCSAEDLVIQKVIADRDKDWQDVEGILAEQYGHLDYRYIEDWLEQFAEALERPNLIERYENIRERVATILRKPKAASPPES